MKHLSHTLSSLIIAALVSFLVPVGIISAILASIFIVFHVVPYGWGVHSLYLEVMVVIKTFGGGSVIKGMTTIALTTMFVGILLTGFNLFYTYYSQPVSSRAGHY